VLNEQSIDLWKKQVEMILDKNGLASFIVHPDYIIEPETQTVYRDLLSMLSELRGREDLWFALPRDIDSWWRARSRMSIVKEEESWRIVGEGAQHAVLAFAKSVDGKLIYELADASLGELPAQFPLLKRTQRHQHLNNELSITKSCRILLTLISERKSP